MSSRVWRENFSESLKQDIPKKKGVKGSKARRFNFLFVMLIASAEDSPTFEKRITKPASLMPSPATETGIDAATPMIGMKIKK